jgi:hypothetical protein
MYKYRVYNFEEMSKITIYNIEELHDKIGGQLKK